MKKTRTITRKSITPAQFRNFIFAGRSVFTLENNETQNYITFKVKQIKKRGVIVPDNFAIECKSLGDSESGYQFLGFLDTKKQTFKRWGHAPQDFVGYKTLFWLLGNLEGLERFSTKLAIYHEGICCKCGRPLTVPESIDNGIGPECYSRMLETSKAIMVNLGSWDDMLDYEGNVRKALRVDPTIWNKIHVPEHVKMEDSHGGHRLLSRLGIF